MSALGEIYIKKETLQTILSVLEKGGGNEGKGISITLSINDDSDQYGQNISSYVSQSKEEREAKKNRFFTGNGRVFWTDSSIKTAVKPGDKTTSSPAESSSDDSSNDLPF